MKINTAHIIVLMTFLCTSTEIMKGMNDFPYSLRNTGTRPFTAYILRGAMQRVLESSHVWKMYNNPQNITIEFTEGSTLVSTVFIPKKPHTNVKIVESEQDHGFFAIIDNDDTVLLTEPEEPSPFIQNNGRPQTAPAHCSRHR